MPKAVGILMIGQQPITILYADHHICKVPSPFGSSCFENTSYEVKSMFQGDGTVMFQKHPGFDVDCDSTTLFSDFSPQAYPSYSPFEIQSLAKTKGYPLRYDFRYGFNTDACVAKVIRHGLDKFEEIFVSPRFVEDCINAGVEIYWLETNWKSFFKTEWNKLLAN